MSEAIKRFYPGLAKLGPDARDWAPRMVPNSGGGYVFYSDHAAEVERLRKEIELRAAIMDRMPLCPDHRDKQTSCPACEVERLRGLLAKPGPIEAALNARVRELERGLSDAEEAIRDLVRAGDAMRFSMPTAAMAGKSAWDDVRNQPAVRRALGDGR